MLFDKNPITQLLNLGKKQHFLTTEQINNVFPDMRNNQQFDNFKILLDGMHIHYLEQEPTESQRALFNTYDDESSENTLSQIDHIKNNVSRFF